MNLGTILQSLGQRIPGHDFLSGTRMGDVITGGLARAVERNHWSLPFGHDTSSIDDLAGAGASSSPNLRNLARGVGALFGGGALYGAYGGGSAAAGEGVGELGGGGGGGMESQGLEGSGTAPGGGSGSSGLGWQDYLNYARRGMSLMNQFGGTGAAGGGMGTGGYPVDNSMILPPPPPPQEDSLNSLPPGFLSLLLAQAMQRQQQTQPERPAIDSMGAI